MIFIVCGVVVPILFIVILVLAIIFTIQNKDKMNTEKATMQNIETESVVSFSDTDNVKIEETTIVKKDSEINTTDYEDEKIQSAVPITGMTQKEVDHLGDDKTSFEQKMNEFIVGYGYQNSEEIRLEESKLDAEEKTFIMTFVLKTHLYKDPYIVVKYHKPARKFDIQIW